MCVVHYILRSEVGIFIFSKSYGNDSISFVSLSVINYIRLFFSFIYIYSVCCVVCAIVPKLNSYNYTVVVYFRRVEVLHTIHIFIIFSYSSFYTRIIICHHIISTKKPCGGVISLLYTSINEIICVCIK